MKKTMLLAAAGALMAMAATPVSATTKTTKTFSSWQVDCVEAEKKKICALSQVLINQKTKQRVMSMAVRKPKDETSKVVLQVPLGANIAAGVNLTLDDSSPVKIAYKTCLPKGCVAEFELTDDWVKAFGSGVNCTVSVTGLKGESVPFKITLKGFTDAYAYFASEAP